MSSAPICLRAWLAALLAWWSVAALATEPAAGEPTPGARLEAAMADFTARAVEKLAASQSPRERWIAGLLLLDESMRAGDRSDALRERAQGLLDGALEAGGEDATLLFWALLDPPMRQTADAAATAQSRLRMLARLQRLEPDNAVVWIGALPARDAAGAIPLAIEALRRAAAAKRFDTHFSASMRMLVGVFQKVPLPEDWPDTAELPGWEGVQREDLPTILAVGVGNALAMPYLVTLQWWCGGNSAEHPWLADCRTVARGMVERSDSIVTHSLGLALELQLYPSDSEAAQRAQKQRRELAWLVESGMQRVGPGKPVSFGEWRRAWAAAGATELSVARALVKAQGLPSSPPADFAPAWDRPAAAPGD